MAVFYWNAINTGFQTRYLKHLMYFFTDHAEGAEP